MDMFGAKISIDALNNYPKVYDISYLIGDNECSVSSTKPFLRDVRELKYKLLKLLCVFRPVLIQ